MTYICQICPGPRSGLAFNVAARKQELGFENNQTQKTLSLGSKIQISDI